MIKINKLQIVILDNYQKIAINLVCSQGRRASRYSTAGQGPRPRRDHCLWTVRENTHHPTARPTRAASNARCLRLPDTIDGRLGVGCLGAPVTIAVPRWFWGFW